MFTVFNVTLILFIGSLLITVVVTEAFLSQYVQHFRIPTKLNNGNKNPGPPLNWGQPTNDNNNDNPPTLKDGEEPLKANRWSKFAPDTNLPAEEFRNELKENMKRDLERRRAADPNRGNQPAKSYLDSL